MANQPQLEIISPSGDIEFYDLDARKGITNIGQHPDNDIVIESPNMAPFYAVLDHRQLPYQFVVLNRYPETALGGASLSPDVPAELHNWDTIEFDGYALILIEGEGVPVTEAAAEAEGVEPSMALLPGTDVSLATFFFEQTDDLIVTEMSEREWTVDVEEPATFQVTVINGGSLVAGFDIHVEGIDASWVTISKPQVNLYEGAREMVTLSIIPPRAPTSTAGVHPLAVVVTSHNYPGHVSRMTATLTVNPYYEFSVSDLAPKRQTVSRSRLEGKAFLSLTNDGNSKTAFTLEGSDDERACTFEFQMPGEQAALAGQVGLQLLPDETITIPVQITPPPPQFFSLRKRTRSFQITTVMQAADQLSRTLMGQVDTKPLFGLIHLVLACLVLAILTWIIFTPRIFEFESETSIVYAGDSTRLRWRVFPFNKLQIDNLEEEILGVSGEMDVTPAGAAVTYRLRANTWLSQLIPVLVKEASRQTTVLVVPPSPVVKTFSVDKASVLYGDSVVVNWEVSNAEEVILKAGEMTEIIAPEEHVGQREIVMESDTLLSLEARNSANTDLRSAMVQVALPNVESFVVEPTEIMAGQTVKIIWNVSGVKSVAIAPLPDTYPPSGSTTHTPLETLDYILSAVAADQELKEMRHVVVYPTPPPTPEPEAPVIEFFTATPEEVEEGGGAVQLAWSVLGKTTDIEITSLNSFNGTNLSPQDIMTLNINQPTVFVITARYEDLHASQTVAVKVAKTEPEPTPTPVAGPQIVFFKAEGVDGSEEMVVFSAQQDASDGPVYVYEVENGSTVKLSWETANADAVTLSDESQPTAGDVTRTVDQVATFKLTAKNAAGEVHAYIQFNVEWVNLPNKVFLPMVLRGYSVHPRR